jgi:hypothetical protein
MSDSMLCVVVLAVGWWWGCTRAHYYRKHTTTERVIGDAPTGILETSKRHV